MRFSKKSQPREPLFKQIILSRYLEGSTLANDRSDGCIERFSRLRAVIDALEWGSSKVRLVTELAQECAWSDSPHAAAMLDLATAVIRIDRGGWRDGISPNASAVLYFRRTREPKPSWLEYKQTHGLRFD